MRLLDDLPRCKLAEGPLWDADGFLYWVDIVGHAIHRHEPATGAVATHALDEVVGFCAVMADGGAGGTRLAAGSGAARLGRGFGEPGGPRELARPPMPSGTRFNDGKCDPRGRLWAGTMHIEARRDRAPDGALYRWQGGSLEVVEPRVSLANGLGWSPAGDILYFSDTHAGTVWAYPYDLATGGVGRRRAFAEVPLEEGVPDGLAVDASGRVTVAIWRGGKLAVFAPDGTREADIPVPVRNPTSCAFGGGDLRTLYVTTMPSSNEDDERSGRLFATAVAVPGLPSARMDPTL